MTVSNQTKDLFGLSLNHREATFLDDDARATRRRIIEEAYDPEGLAALRSTIDDYIEGRGALTAVELYTQLEQSSMLMLLHTLPRRSARNRYHNGLQQSYGDHIKLIMLGFDMFDQSDVDWMMDRRWSAPTDVERDELQQCVARYHQLGLNRAEKVAMWITSALHDYGKIFRRGYGLDAEDAAPLCKHLVEALAPTGMIDLINYGIRNHDLIEHTVTGDTPTDFITRPISSFPADLQPRAMQMLALIQLIGAASLGEGRVTKAKVDIFNACLDGAIVAANDIETRLGRLLSEGGAVPDPNATAAAAADLEALQIEQRALLASLLQRAVLHGWSDVRSHIAGQETDQAHARQRWIETLTVVAEHWAGCTPEPTHVVLARPEQLADSTKPGAIDHARTGNEDKLTELLNGSRALILR